MKTMYLLLMAGVLAMAGCTTIHREQAPKLMFSTAAPIGFQSDVRYISTDPQAIESRFSEMIERRRAVSRGAALNILALSGGGAGGSFGAGAVVGMSRLGNRPQFDIVTGVSAGALIAPFAFLGSSWDARLDENFSGAHSDNFLILRGISILFRPGVYQNKPLVEFVDHFVTDEMIREVSAQSASGRSLLVATTDLDKEETIIWDMGKIASRGGEEARTLFRDVLVASASIPGVFAPVIIHVEINGVRYDEMHVDASTTVPFLVAPAMAYILPLEPNGLKGANIFVLINGQLTALPLTTKIDSVSILSRSISAERNHMARTQIALTSEFAQKYGMNFRLTAIPVDYDFQGPLEFKKSTSRSLFDYGADCARKDMLWTTVEQAIARNESALANEIVKNRNKDTRPIPSCPMDGSTRYNMPSLKSR